MIGTMLIFIIGISLALLAIYDWRIALRFTIPIALVIASLVALDIYLTKNPDQQRETQLAPKEHLKSIEERVVQNNLSEVRKRLDKAEMELQRIEQAEKVRKLKEEHESVVKEFFNKNRSLIELYFNSASRCHSALTFTGKMEDNAHCQAAIEARSRLEAITEQSLSGISKEELKKEDSTSLWRMEYAQSQLDSAYQRSKHRE